jgi:hypothetical protein
VGRGNNFIAMLLIMRDAFVLLAIVDGLDINSSDDDVRQVVKDWSCALPNTNKSVEDYINRRYMMVGNDEEFILSQRYSTPGIGNYLVFGPALFWFAALTSRNVVIGDGIMAEFCNYVNCRLNGFKSKSDLIDHKMYDNMSELHPIGRHQMIKHLQGSMDFLNINNVRGNTNVPATDFFVWFPYAAQCVKRLSNCSIGDVGCSERFAYQRMFPGPVQNIPGGVFSSIPYMILCIACLPFNLRLHPSAARERFIANVFHTANVLAPHEDCTSRSCPVGDTYFSRVSHSTRVHPL